MSETDIPAGWQPDPRGRHEYRYWDGTQWTDHVSDKGEVSQDPVADVGGSAEPAASAGAASEPATEVQPESAPEPVAASEPVAAGEPDPAPEPVAATPTPGPEPTPASSASPPGGPTEPATNTTSARAAADELISGKSDGVATILSVIAPGSGHFYLGASNAVPVGVGLLGATLLGVVLAYFSFLLFIIGLVIIVGAAGFALVDLRGGVEAVQNVSVPANIGGILLLVAGVLMLVGLFLPFYHIKVDAGQLGSIGGNVSAWDAFEILRLIWLIVAVAAIVAGAASLGLGPVTAAELPTSLPQIVAIGGAVAAVLVLFRMFVDGAGLPDTGGTNVDLSVGRAFGAFILLDAGLIIVLSNLGLLRSLRQNR